MNYEKEYKKLKADIEKAYLFAQTDSTKSVLEHILPELRESEDERIRKEILEVAKTVVLRDGTLYGKKYNCREWIPWLEKQAENHVNIDIDEMVDKFTKTELKFDGTLCAVVDAYRKGITDALIKQNLL